MLEVARRQGREVVPDRVVTGDGHREPAATCVMPGVVRTRATNPATNCWKLPSLTVKLFELTTIISVGRWPNDAPIAWRYRASAWLDCVVPTTCALVVRPLSEVATRISATTTAIPQIASTRRARLALATASLSVRPTEPRPSCGFGTTPVSWAASGPTPCAALGCAGGRTRNSESGASWPASSESLIWVSSRHENEDSTAHHQLKTAHHQLKTERSNR